MKAWTVPLYNVEAGLLVTIYTKEHFIALLVNRFPGLRLGAVTGLNADGMAPGVDRCSMPLAPRCRRVSR